MPAPRYDESRWPLFSVCLPQSDLDDGEFGAFLDKLDGLNQRMHRFAVLLDARAAPPLAPKRRKLIAARANAAQERHPGLMVGFAVVLSSPVQRGVFTAIHWLLRRSDATRAFATMADAEAWLSSRLSEERGGGLSQDERSGS
jgi:hypothetical protein